VDPDVPLLVRMGWVVGVGVGVGRGWLVLGLGMVLVLGLWWGWLGVVGGCLQDSVIVAAMLLLL